MPILDRRSQVFVPEDECHSVNVRALHSSFNSINRACVFPWLDVSSASHGGSAILEDASRGQLNRARVSSSEWRHSLELHALFFARRRHDSLTAIYDSLSTDSVFGSATFQ